MIWEHRSLVEGIADITQAGDVNEQCAKQPVQGRGENLRNRY